MLFFRRLVILNGCEGSLNRVKSRYFALLSMTNNICYIITILSTKEQKKLSTMG